MPENTPSLWRSIAIIVTVFSRIFVIPLAHPTACLVDL